MKEKTYKDLTFQKKVLYNQELMKGEWNLIYIALAMILFILLLAPVLVILTLIAWIWLRWRYDKKLKKFIEDNC